MPSTLSEDPLIVVISYEPLRVKAYNVRARFAHAYYIAAAFRTLKYRFLLVGKDYVYRERRARLVRLVASGMDRSVFLCVIAIGSIWYHC